VPLSTAKQIVNSCVISVRFRFNYVLKRPQPIYVCIDSCAFDDVYLISLYIYVVSLPYICIQLLSESFNYIHIHIDIDILFGAYKQMNNPAL